jgi:hypothetical protein
MRGGISPDSAINRLFGPLQRMIGMRRLRLSGLASAAEEFTMAAAAESGDQTPRTIFNEIIQSQMQVGQDHLKGTIIAAIMPHRAET